MNAQYLSDKHLACRYHTSKPTIWRWAREKKFPSPVKLSAGCTRWKLSDIEKWEAEREAITCR